jgi:hypothetical protein
MKMKRKEFADLKQGGMTVNEYLNSFIQLSRYAPDDIQFQLLNTDYADFQHMVDKAIVVENKIREMEKDGKRKVPFSGQSFGSNVRPRFSQLNVIPRSEKEGTKPPYVCSGCSNHTCSNNMINRFNVQ